MGARILDGRLVAESIKNGLSEEVKTFKSSPCLAVCLIGTDPASQVYVKHKRKACGEVGINSLIKELPASATTDDVLAVIHAWNSDPAIHGILVQLPLPAGVDRFRVINAINPLKDVDCFTAENVGRLSQGVPRFEPCTPAGIVELLKFYNICLQQPAVIINRSNVVGLPLATMLTRLGATVSVFHEQTHWRHWQDMMRVASIVVTAVGRPNFKLDPQHIQPGAVVVDVAIRRQDGKLMGDCLCGDHLKVIQQKAGWVTPVPGGVGPMTVAMLLKNTVSAARGLSC